MKKQILLSSMLLLGLSVFAQKKELREVEKAINKSELAQAQSLLSQIQNVEDKYQAKYYFLKGKLNFEKAKRNQQFISSLLKATNSFNQSEKAGKDYVSDIRKIKQEALRLAQENAGKLYNDKKIKEAAPVFELVYRLSPTDTIYLYNAAQLAWQEKDYQTSLKYLLELKDLRYDGSEMVYSAKNKETGKVEDFSSKHERDLMVKSKAYIEPKDTKTPSRRADIVKLIAGAYIENGQKEEAIQAFEEARKMAPNDANLVIHEAYIYWQLENKEKFKELLLEALSLDPNNADTHFNIGVANSQLGDKKAAREAFEKALAIRPDYTDAAMNISTIYINEGNDIIEQMNNIRGNTKADLKKYDELKAAKEQTLQKAADVLENYIATQKPTKSVLDQLKNIYAALGEAVKAKKYKDMAEAME